MAKRKPDGDNSDLGVVGLAIFIILLIIILKTH